jgi:hypothetical protein
MSERSKIEEEEEDFVANFGEFSQSQLSPFIEQKSEVFVASA